MNFHECITRLSLIVLAGLTGHAHGMQQDPLTTLLHASAMQGNIRGAKLILQDPAARAAINAKNKGGQTALHCAATMNHDAMVELLLAANANPDAQDNDGNTALLMATGLGNEAVVTRLSKVSKTDIANKQRMTPIDLAIMRNNPAMLGCINTNNLEQLEFALVIARKISDNPEKSLRKTNPDVSAQTLEANHKIIVSMLEAKIKALREKQSKPFIQSMLQLRANPVVHDTPLTQMPTVTANNAVVQILVNQGPAVQNNQQSAAETTLTNAFASMLKTLSPLQIFELSGGCNQENGRLMFQGKSILSLCILEQAPIAELEKILENQAERDAINIGDSTFGTPLHCAVSKAQPDVIALLLKHGAKVEIPTAQGHTSLDLSLASNNPTVTALLAAKVNDLALITKTLESARKLKVAGPGRLAIAQGQSLSTLEENYAEIISQLNLRKRQLEQLEQKAQEDKKQAAKNTWMPGVVARTLGRLDFGAQVVSTPPYRSFSHPVHRGFRFPYTGV